MRIDFKAYTAAMLPPQIVIGGQTYTGRHLGFLESLEFQRRMVEESADGGIAVCRDLFIAMGFGEAVDAILSHPCGVVMAVVRDFFAAAAGAPARSEPAMPGTTGPTPS